MFRGLRARARRVPGPAWVCALVAFLGGVVWSLIVPPFQVPDEPAHVAYAQYVAEYGEPPPGEVGQPGVSDEQKQVMDALRYKQIEFRPDNRPLRTPRAKKKLERALENPTSPRGEGGSSHATSIPPLYYALEAGVYRTSPSTNLLDRLQLMRLFSALLAGITVLFVFMFLRELLPSAPWVWLVGALAVGLQPVFGNISGAVHSDNLMYPAAAGILYVLALCFRRGLTNGRGAALGGLVAVGLLAKPTMLGVLPGVALALLIFIWKAGPDRRRSREAVFSSLVAVACAGVPVLFYVVLNSTVWDHGVYFGGGGEKEERGAGETTITGGLSYIWQFYLPRLSWMEPQFDKYQLTNAWFDGFVGKFGVLEYGFPSVVDAVAAVVYGLIVFLAARELIRCRSAIRARAAELIVYVVIAISVLVAIHWAGYVGRTLFYPGFEQVRYLFPLLAFYGAIIALAARGAGRHGPAAGILIVSLAVAHSLLAVLLTLTRYYG